MHVRVWGHSVLNGFRDVQPNVGPLNHLALVLCIFLSLLCTSCGARCSDRVIDVSTRINLVDLSVETADGKVLWRVAGNGHSVSLVKYGVLPAHAVQRFPAIDRSPRTPSPGERIVIKAYSMESFYFVHAVVDEHGRFCIGAYETGKRADLKRHERSLR